MYIIWGGDKGSFPNRMMATRRKSIQFRPNQTNHKQTHRLNRVDKMGGDCVYIWFVLLVVE